MKIAILIFCFFLFILSASPKRINLSTDKRVLFFDYNDYYESGEWKDLSWETPKFLKLLQESCLIEFSKRGMRNIFRKNKEHCKYIHEYTLEKLKTIKTIHMVEREKCLARYGSLCTMDGNLSQIFPCANCKENLRITGHYTPDFNSSIVKYFWEHSSKGCEPIQNLKTEQDEWLKKRKIPWNEEQNTFQLYDISACDVSNKNIILLYNPYENTVVLFRDSFGEFSYFAALVYVLLNIHWFLHHDEKNTAFEAHKSLGNFIFSLVFITFYFFNGIVFLIEDESIFFLFSIFISGLFGFFSMSNMFSTAKTKQLENESCLYSIAAIFCVLYRTVENPYALIFVFIFLLRFLSSCFVEMELLVEMADGGALLVTDKSLKNEFEIYSKIFIETFEKICIVIMAHWFLLFGFLPIFESSLSVVVYLEVGFLATYCLCIYKQKKKFRNI